MNCTSQNALRDLLIAVGQGERQIECLRQALCSICGFAPADAFARINKDANGSITADEIYNFLHDNYSYYGCKAECAQLVKFWNSNVDTDSLTLAEFQPMLLPCENNDLKTATLKRASREAGKCTHLPCHQNHALVAIIEAELALQRNIESLKRWLGYGSDYSVEAAFAAIGGKDGKLLNAENMKAFLNESCHNHHSCHGGHHGHHHGHHHGGYYGHHYGGHHGGHRSHSACDTDVQAIIRRLDTNSDNAVGLDEWASFLYVAPVEQPKEVIAPVAAPVAAPKAAPKAAPVEAPKVATKAAPVEAPKVAPKAAEPAPITKVQPVAEPAKIPEVAETKEVDHHHHHHGHHHGHHHIPYYVHGYHGHSHGHGYHGSYYSPSHYYGGYYGSYYPSRSYNSYYHYPSYARHSSYSWRYSGHYNYSDSYLWRCY